MNHRALEEATARFYDWELRGRGWQEYSHRVTLEPRFRPFEGYRVAPAVVIDDARKPTLVSSLIARITRSKANASAPFHKAEADPDPDEVASPEAPNHEFEVLVPPDEKIDPHAVFVFLASLSGVGALCFELVGSAGQVSIRFSGGPDAAAILLAQLEAFVPQATIRKPPRTVLDLWAECSGEAYYSVDFGLAREFMVPLKEVRANPDPLTAFVGALTGASGDSIAILQVLFEPVRSPWAESIERSVTSPDGEPFFVDAPEITSLAEEKTSSPLYAAAVRVLVRASDDVASSLLNRVAAGLNQYAAPGRNAFVPLAHEDGDSLVADILTRTTHRSGMLLSLDELTSIVRLPSEHLRSPALLREIRLEKPLPAAALSGEGVVLGEASHRGKTQLVRIPIEPRLSHAHIIGASGTGKSTLLENLILQDIVEGRGVGVIDPHGDLVDAVMARIPDERIDDVVVFDPSDDEGIVGWNILGAHSEIEKELLASDLVSVFRRLSTSWGDQMSVLLANAVLAFLESSQGGTLVDLRKFLLDDAFREAFLRTVRDDHVLSFWKEEYPLLIGKKPQAPILTRLDTFLRSKLIRERVTEREKPLNFREIIDSGRIFLAKLSQGAIGEENAALLGSLIVSKFHQVSLSRQNVAQKDRRPFFLFIDEFQQVAVPSMAGLFSGVRKYHLAVTVAHQDLYQLHANAPELERAALTNAYTRLVFRVNSDDARKLERDLGEFTADDLTNLGRGQAICRLGRSEDSFKLATLPLAKVDPSDAELRQTRIRRTSVARWGRPRVAPPKPPSDASPPFVTKPETRAQTQPSIATEPGPPTEAAAPGRGGATHKYLQGMIGEWARTHGFKAEIEHTLPEGGRVDVALIRDELRIACEIAGTTTTDHEMANARKCLAAGFTHVCAVSLDLPFLRRLENVARKDLADADRERVHFMTPEELLAFLGTQMMTQQAPRVAGYKVELRQSATAQESVDRKRAVAEIMLNSVRRMRGKK
jgi:hypothetical protein